jgi:hypothetical protein
MSLPDNRMKPKQSGVNVWLQEQMIERLGNERAQSIINEASTHDTKRYAYMIGVLDTLGHPDIGEEYKRKQKADTHERFVRDKKRYLAGFKQELERCTSPQRSAWLRGRIQKIEDYLSEAEHTQTATSRKVVTQTGVP